MKRNIALAGNVSPLVDGGDFGTGYFPLLKKFKANRERELTGKSPLYTNGCWWLFLFHNSNLKKNKIMKTKNEQLMIIQALGTCIARKKQKSNRRKRILEESESKEETGLHQLRRNVYKGIEEIQEFENLKQKLENEFSEK